MKRKSISLMLTLAMVMQFSTPMISKVLAYEISRTSSSTVTGNLEVLMNLKVPIMFNKDSKLKLTLKSKSGKSIVDVDLMSKEAEKHKVDDDDNILTELAKKNNRCGCRNYYR